MHIELGTRVRTSDGKDAGMVDRLIVDPDKNDIKAVVLRKGVVIPHDVEVALDDLAAEPDGAVRIAYTADQIKNMPDFDDSAYMATPPPGYTWPAGYPLAGLYWPAWGAPIGAGTTLAPPLGVPGAEMLTPSGQAPYAAPSGGSIGDTDV